MSVSDPVADFLTCIRNAIGAKHRKVDVPSSRMATFASDAGDVR